MSNPLDVTHFTAYLKGDLSSHIFTAEQIQTHNLQVELGKRFITLREDTKVTGIYQKLLQKGIREEDIEIQAFKDKVMVIFTNNKSDTEIYELQNGDNELRQVCKEIIDIASQVFIQQKPSHLTQTTEVTRAKTPSLNSSTYLEKTKKENSFTPIEKPSVLESKVNEIASSRHVVGEVSREALSNEQTNPDLHLSEDQIKNFLLHNFSPLIVDAESLSNSEIAQMLRAQITMAKAQAEQAKKALENTDRELKTIKSLSTQTRRLSASLESASDEMRNISFLEETRPTITANETLRALEEELFFKEQQISQLQAHLESLHTNSVEANYRYNTTLNSFNVAFQEQNEKIASLTEKAENAEKTYRLMDSELKRKQDELYQLQQAKTEVETNLAEVIAKLRNELEQTKTALPKEDLSKINPLLEKLNGVIATSDNDDSFSEISEISEDFVEFIPDIKETIDYLKNHQSDKAQPLMEIDSTEARNLSPIDDLKNKAKNLEGYVAQIAEYEHKINELRDYNQAILEVKDKMLDELAILKNEIERQSFEIGLRKEFYSREKARYESQIGDLLQKLHVLENNYQNTLDALSAMQNETVHTRQEKEEAEQIHRMRLNHLTQQLELLDGSIAEKDYEEIQRLTHVLQKTYGELDALEKEFEEDLSREAPITLLEKVQELKKQKSDLEISLFNQTHYLVKSPKEQSPINPHSSELEKTLEDFKEAQAQVSAYEEKMGNLLRENKALCDAKNRMEKDIEQLRMQLVSKTDANEPIVSAGTVEEEAAEISEEPDQEILSLDPSISYLKDFTDVTYAKRIKEFADLLLKREEISHEINCLTPIYRTHERTIKVLPESKDSPETIKKTIDEAHRLDHTIQQLYKNLNEIDQQVESLIPEMNITFDKIPDEKTKAFLGITHLKLQLRYHKQLVAEQADKIAALEAKGKAASEDVESAAKMKLELEEFEKKEKEIKAYLKERQNLIDEREEQIRKLTFLQEANESYQLQLSSTKKDRAEALRRSESTEHELKAIKLELAKARQALARAPVVATASLEEDSSAKHDMENHRIEKLLNKLKDFTTQKNILKFFGNLQFLNMKKALLEEKQTDLRKLNSGTKNTLDEKERVKLNALLTKIQKEMLDTTKNLRALQDAAGDNINDLFTFAIKADEQTLLNYAYHLSLAYEELIKKPNEDYLSKDTPLLSSENTQNQKRFYQAAQLILQSLLLIYTDLNKPVTQAKSDNPDIAFYTQHIKGIMRNLIALFSTPFSSEEAHHCLQFLQVQIENLKKFESAAQDQIAKLENELTKDSEEYLREKKNLEDLKIVFSSSLTFLEEQARKIPTYSRIHHLVTHSSVKNSPDLELQKRKEAVASMEAPYKKKGTSAT